jgi:hypothetical protein
LHAKQDRRVLFSFWKENYSTVGSISIIFWHNFTMSVCGIASQQKIESKSWLCTRHVINKNRYTHLLTYIGD